VEAAAVERCPRCGAPQEPLQEYCLDCGLRLPRPPGQLLALGAAWRRRLRWYPGDWIWPTAALLAIAAVGGLASYLASRPDRGQTTIVATAQPPTVVRAASAVGTGTSAAGNGLTVWPSGKAGFTVVLELLPTSRGKAAAQSFARRAARAGIPQTGYVRSSRFSSLHPGYYVVFSGVYASRGAAEDAASTAASKGFTGAAAQRLVP
jgi:hypothetical protein